MHCSAENRFQLSKTPSLYAMGVRESIASSLPHLPIMLVDLEYGGASAMKKSKSTVTFSRITRTRDHLFCGARAPCSRLCSAVGWR